MSSAQNDKNLDDIENDRKLIEKKFIQDLLKEEDSSPVIVDEDI